jgi:hypothetical protein
VKQPRRYLRGPADFHPDLFQFASLLTGQVGSVDCRVCCDDIQSVVQGVYSLGYIIFEKLNPRRHQFPRCVLAPDPRWPRERWNRLGFFLAFMGGQLPRGIRTEQEHQRQYGGGGSADE